MRGFRPAAVSVFVGLIVATSAAGQSSAPKLSRAERSAMQALVAAVDAAASAPASTTLEWPIHLLRASDGSHYVAFSLVAPPGLRSDQQGIVYVRLATRQPGVARVAERSMVAEWLAGRTNTPLKREHSIALGDMPTFGAASAANAGRDPASTGRGVASQNLQLMELERERARERHEAQDRDRKAALDGEKATPANGGLLPFEDFDLHAAAITDASGVPSLRRSLTAGPGEYDLFVGWVDPAGKDPGSTIQVFKRTLQLPSASTTAFGLSSVIVADEVSVRQTPVSPEQQTAHPYSIGTTEIVPARDTHRTSDGRLALVVQVINPHAEADGKPDVAVGFRITRRTAAGQEQVGTLTPQIYNRTTLPADFDGNKGQPIFAAVAVPMRTFKRGQYRLEVMADDRLAGVSAITSTDFDIVSTPAALLGDAPALVMPFKREDILEPAVLDAIVGRLRPTVPSTALAAALDAVRQRRFVDLVRDDAVTAEEQGARTFLRALALYALGDTPVGLASALRQATAAAAPPGPLQVLTGATRAIEGSDRDAMAAWQAAIDAGIDRGVLAPLLIDAALRVKDAAGAAELATSALAVRPSDPALTHRLAAARLAGNEIDAAIQVTDARLRQAPDDTDAQWLMLHALFTGFAKGQGPGSDADGHARIKDLASRYAQAGGKHAALATEWAEAVK